MFVLENMGLGWGGWGKYKSVMGEGGGVEGDRGGVCCLLEVPSRLVCQGHAVGCLGRCDFD